MIEIEQKVLYEAFGLSLTSDIPLPELNQISEPVDTIDIEIKTEDLSRLWLELNHGPNMFVVKDRFVMFQIPDVATFSIQEGKRITVSPFKGAEEDVLRLYILGTCIGVLMMQRKIYPLHGSAVAIDGKAYAFIGDSGVGKSTLASAFLSRGYHLVSDDVIAVSLSAHDNRPVVTPSYPQQKLWQESLNEFGMETSAYRSIFGRETKYCIPVSSQYFTEPLPLAGVFELIKKEEKGIEVQQIRGLEILHTLFSHTYRNLLISPLGLMDWHFNISAKIAHQIEAYRIHRPSYGFTAFNLTDLILRKIKKEEAI